MRVRGAGDCRHGCTTEPAARRRRLRLCGAVAAGVLLASGAAAQSPPANSLVVDPQQGATPRPLAPAADVAEAPLPAAPASPPPSSAIVIPAAPVVAVRGTAAATGEPLPAPVPLLQAEGGLPAPSGDPLRIDPAADPILQLTRTAGSPAAFNGAIAAAVQRNPQLDEANAQVDLAEGLRGEARASALPIADLSISTFKVISRAFSNDPKNILERSRPSERTDALLRVQQALFDFGYTHDRIQAAAARLEAARISVEDVATQVALRAVSEWYSVYGYRVLVSLAEGFSATQHNLRASVEQRVRQGAAAPADLAQIDSYIASADAQRADFRRLLASAEAQYTALVGSPPPPDLARAPVPALDGIARPTLAADTDRLPAVRAAAQVVEGARLDARGLKAERLPRLGAALDAGRYGVFENARDYDVRGSVTLSVRLGGPGAAQVRQGEARLALADARLRRTRIEAQRDAEIALADVAALSEANTALESNYIASRRSRDVLAERFRVSRGTIFDLLNAQGNYFGVTARYLQSTIELDSARYALLARTGRLLPALGIDAAALESR